MLKAKLDSVRKNKKGFSLVELIIVIAIMVALIAVMAPAFVKYVQKSRDAALTSAAEDYHTAAKTYIADPETTAFPADGSKIVIGWDSGTQAITFDGSNVDDDIKAEIDKLAGVDLANPKKMGKTNLQYTITFTGESGDISCSMKLTRS